MASKRRKFTDGLDLPQPSSSELRGKQSVRATFKLTERAIETLAVVSIHLGVKQKSLFDHLIEDSQSLNSIARQIEADRFGKLARIQKTFVLSRGTLLKLESASELFQMPRDALVEYSIRRLNAIIEEEREKHETRKKLLDEVRVFVERGHKLLETCRGQLNDEDPLTAAVASAVKSCTDAGYAIEQMVERGRAIEDY